MKIALVTDAWHPQINGVVMTLERVGRELVALGHELHFITPQAFRTVPCPGYAEIRLALFPGRRLGRMLAGLRPDTIHIATEGPLGVAARHYCRKRRLAFTTSYHTRFPEYLRARVPLPTRLSYAWLRRFHAAAARTMVATPSLERELAGRGFRNLVRWTRGVDTRLFRPRDKDFLDLPRPVFAYLGRVAVEKNIEAFLALDLPGSKLVIGDGPDLRSLRSRYPQARFVGYRRGEDLARHLAAADAFVFPSRTDTFGLVLLEAMACGLPVAAYPVMGPVDVVRQGVSGVLDEDLQRAALACLRLDPAACRREALAHGWRRSAEQFLDNLVPVGGRPGNAR